MSLIDAKMIDVDRNISPIGDFNVKGNAIQVNALDSPRDDANNIQFSLGAQDSLLAQTQDEKMLISDLSKKHNSKNRATKQKTEMEAQS